MLIFNILFILYGKLICPLLDSIVDACLSYVCEYTPLSWYTHPLSLLITGPPHITLHCHILCSPPNSQIIPHSLILCCLDVGEILMVDPRNQRHNQEWAELGNHRALWRPWMADLLNICFWQPTLLVLSDQNVPHIWQLYWDP